MKTALSLEQIEHDLSRPDLEEYFTAVQTVFRTAVAAGIDVRVELEAEELGIDGRAWYALCRLQGSSPRLALMFATGRPPCVADDTTFWRGRWNQFADHPYLGDYYRKVAADHGMTDTGGSVYMPGLARFPGDPEAWVKGKGDIKNVLEKRGWGCEGEVNVKARNDMAPKADVDVADDIVQQRVLQMTDANPDLEHTDQTELYHQAKDSLLPAA